MPHSPLVSQIRCHNPNERASKVRNRNYLMYIGTREGVDLSPEQELNHEAPNEIYIKYMAERPRSHGLFGNIDTTDICRLSNDLADMTAGHKNIYRGFVSITGEDALHLGYDAKEKWIIYMRSVMPDIAKTFSIPIEQLQWAAAVHMEASHPHCHFMFWQKDAHIRSPFIHKSVQNRCRQIFSKEMFREEREQLIIDKTLHRDYMIDTGKDMLLDELNALLQADSSAIPPRFKNKDLNTIAKALCKLKEVLPGTGRLTYKLLPPDCKQQVNQIVDLLLDTPDMKREYLKYIDSVNAVSDSYSAGKKGREANLYRADADLRKRLGNLVLRTCKPLLQNDSAKHMHENYENNLAIYQSYYLLSGVFRILSHSINANKYTAEANAAAFKSHSKEARIAEAKKHPHTP